MKAYAWQLIKLNLLTVLLCLPVLTMPAALCAMARVAMKLTRDGCCLIWAEWRAEFRRELSRSILYGLVWLLLAGADAALLYSAVTSLSGAAACLGIALGVAASLLLLVHAAYTYALFAIIDLPCRSNLYNACVLSLTEGGAFFSLLLVAVLAWLFVMALPYSLPAFILFLPVAVALAVSTIVDPVIEKRIISPYQK